MCENRFKRYLRKAIIVSMVALCSGCLTPRGSSSKESDVVSIPHIQVEVLPPPWDGATKAQIISQIKTKMPQEYWKKSISSFHKSVADYCSVASQYYDKDLPISAVLKHADNLEEFINAADQIANSATSLGAFSKSLSNDELINIVEDMTSVWDAFSTEFILFEEDWPKFEKTAVPFMRVHIRVFSRIMERMSKAHP